MTDPTVQRHGSSLAFSWPPSPVTVVLSRFHDSASKTEAELTVTARRADEKTALITSAKINLQSLSTRKKLAQDLNDRYPAEWLRMVEQVCVLGLRQHREGEPFALLEPTTSAHVPFLVNPLIYEDHQTLWYAPGGSCKSFLALYLALIACHGACQSGVSSQTVRTLYLDYELNTETVGGRLTALRNGHPELSRYVPYYRHCELPLYQESDVIAEYVAREAIGLVIVDSVALACGGDLASPDSAIKLQRALRAIGCASLVLAHVAKGTQDGQEKSAYGTVFFRELARNVWEAQRAETEGPARVALYQKKNNFGPITPALGFELSFTDGAVRVTSCDPNEEAELEAKLPAPNRIRNLLEDGTPRSAQEIAEALDLKPNVVKNTLSRGHGRKWMRIGENRESKWTCLFTK